MCRKSPAFRHGDIRHVHHAESKGEKLYTRIVDFREDWGPMGELQVEKSIQILAFGETYTDFRI